jgi:hypothetical protein
MPFERKWYLFRDGRQYGPITDDKLRGLIQQGHIRQDDYLWSCDFTDWVRFGSIIDPASLTARSAPRFQFLRGFKRHLSRHVLAQRVSVFKKIGKIVSSPSEFADRYIKEGESRALFDAMKFYAKVFALSFAIALIGEHFAFFEGDSEVRAFLIRLLPQLCIGTLVLFVVLLIARNRVPLSGLLQVILYLDGVYMLVDTLVASAVWYADYSLQTLAGPKEIDLFRSEFEKCIAAKSFGYWLIRGDLQFFMYDDKWYGWAQQLMDQRRYIIVIPFLFLFAQMARKKYKSNLIVAVLAAGVAFVSASATCDWVEGKATQVLADKTNCGSTYVQAVLVKHGAERIAKQLELKLSNAFKQSFPNVRQTFWLAGNEYVVALKAPDPVNATQVSAATPQFFRSAYCSQHPYWIAVRGMGYSLIGFVFDQDRTIVSLKLNPDEGADTDN